MNNIFETITLVINFDDLRNIEVEISKYITDDEVTILLEKIYNKHRYDADSDITWAKIKEEILKESFNNTIVNRDLKIDYILS